MTNVADAVTNRPEPANDDAAASHQKANDRHNVLTRSILAFLALATIVIPVCVVTLRTPKTMPMVETAAAEESLPSLLGVAPIGTMGMGGAILLEYITLPVEDNESIVRYYVKTQDLSILEPADNTTIVTPEVTNPDNIALYLVASSDLQAEDLPQATTGGARNLRGQALTDKIAAETRALRIGRVTTADIPFRLPDSFVPTDYGGALLVEEYPEEPDKLATIVHRTSFAFVARVPESSSGGSTITETTTTPQLVLESGLQGSYNLNGVSITIDTVPKFEEGKVVERARLVFDVPTGSTAPGPYLYLSSRPFSETRDRNLNDETDLLIPIEGGNDDGQFKNVEGRFEQILDVDVQDLASYENGSWIVWCKPFGVWLGGGAISTK